MQCLRQRQEVVFLSKKLTPCRAMPLEVTLRPFMSRHDNRQPHEIRPVTFQKGIAPHAQGSVLVSFGNTKVICAATIEESVPRWMKEQSKTGGWFGLPIPYSSGCNCSKCDPDDMGYPAGSKHLYRTEGVTKGPKKLSRAQRKAKRK